MTDETENKMSTPAPDPETSGARSTNPVTEHSEEAQDSVVREMRTEWKTTERWTLGINALTLVALIAAAFIYSGQLAQMTVQTQLLATQLASASNDSAKSSERLERQLKLTERQVTATEAAQKVSSRSFDATIQEMKTQADIQKRNALATEQSVKAITDAASAQVKAAEANAEAVRSQMRQDQRAWMTVDIKDLDLEHLKPGQSPAFAYKNTGKTPAINVNADFKLEVVPFDQEPTLNLGSLHNSITTGMTNPGEGSSPPALQLDGHGGTILLSDSLIESLSRGQSYLVVFGTLRYQDTYGAQHQVWRCGWKAFAGSGFPAKKCTDYNGVDN